ncbi:hypothetical protein Nmel_003098 [Mimus melanotis]
MPAEGERYP